ncbi:hypothetical protein Ahy_A06g029109 [Arachis hypogaea]|uniref:Protein FAR1-RELATED SEQUENCE n=1 Tax=Arachis hypogaea TaxID=3818 RepID=A0A445CSB1_ARAHY|nr:hypothetical protein Ahy_A06g029109 [Arachis hypogaea]
MFKQHKELSIFMRCSIENNEEDGIRLSKTYKSFVAVADSHRKLILSSFVGVNHHCQSTLLRCALMKNEDIQSFKWREGTKRDSYRSMCIDAKGY